MILVIKVWKEQCSGGRYGTMVNGLVDLDESRILNESLTVNHE